MTEKLKKEVEAEQDHGRQKYGRGPRDFAHDDAHRREDWVEFVRDKALDAECAIGPQEWRQKMVQIAGLAISAIESFDRKSKK